MKVLFAAAAIAAASFASAAIAQSYPEQQQPGMPPPAQAQPAPAPTPAPAPAEATTETPAESAMLSETIEDAQSTYSRAEVGKARRAWRAACQRYESPGFCMCVSAGIAQALPPSTVRMAANTVGERITAQGSAPGGYETDARTSAGEDPQERIAQVEGHYADACSQFRR